MVAAGTAARLVVAVVLLVGLAAPAGAQTEVFGLQLDGEVELGGRVFLDQPADRERAKLEEFRDLSEQPFGAFRLRLSRPDESYSVELGGDKIGLDDQSFSLWSGRTGLWNFEFEWDQIPHLLSTNARSLETETARGVFVLPTPRPSLSLYNLAPEFDISTRWDIARFGFNLTPTPDLDVTLEYTRIHKSGERPFSMATGSPGGYFVEVARPIDETIHDFRLRGSYSGDGWQVQFGYTLSVYNNDLSGIVIDDPCFRLSAPVAAGGCGSQGLTAPERGQMSLAPDNMAHTFTLAGGVNLPMRTRVTANFTYSIRLQDDDFLPHTINPALASSPLLALPRPSLDGEVHTLLFSVNATSRPLPPLTLSARFRIYDYDDQTSELVFPGHVVSDRTLVEDARIAGRFEYTKWNADVDARWRFGAPAAFTIGGGWERWERNEHREVPRSDEYFAKAALDVTPTDWIVGRLTYRPSFKRISEYNTFAHLEHVVVEELTPDALGQSQSILLRKFDEAERNRHRADLLVSLSPTDVFTVTPTVSYRYDDYIDSPLGLQKSESWTAGFDLSWAPMERLSLFAGYVYESIHHRQRSRSREVTLDVADFDWVSKNVDRVHTVFAGFRASVIPNRLSWTLNLSYSSGTGEIRTTNPVTPTSGTATQDANATAKPYPDTEERLFRLETAVRYHFSKSWSVGLGYIFEKFDNKNWQTDNLAAFNPVSGTGSIWLGSDLQDYTAHYVVMSVAYRF